MYAEIGTSLCWYAATFGLCHVLRAVCRRTLPRPSYQYAVELIDTFQLVCCLFENGMVLRLGLLPFATVLFILTILYALIFEGFANPAAVLDYILRGKLTAVAGILTILVELLGAIAAYRYTTFIWKSSWAPSPRHFHAATVEMISENCSAGLNVSPFVGFAVEMLSVTFLKLVAGVFQGGRRFWRLINAVISVLVVIYGLDYTGALMNPVLGFALGWGCHDHQVPTHLLVYWLGPFTGILVGDWLVDTFLTSTAKKDRRGVTNGAVIEQNGNHAKLH
ncbi:aquaporin-11-like [Diadema antillarum]|uniref:aquaporin-11-like n=1 Tax=Diadema antillarum TaxID=105358 RepID=UPI003A87119A